MPNSSTPTTRGNPPFYRKRCACGCILCTILVIFIILLVAYFTVPSAVLKLPHFQVKSLSLTNFSYTKSVSGTWQINLLIHNPNKKFNLKYDTLWTILYYKNVTLSKSHTTPFRQASKSDTTLNVAISANDVNVAQGYSLLMNKEITERGSVDFNVEIVASIKHVVKRNFFVVCNRIRVRILSNSTSGELVDAIDCQSYNN